MIQLLPVNDTSVYNMWWDSYPYSSVSVRTQPHPMVSFTFSVAALNACSVALVDYLLLATVLLCLP